jgi:dethiobiotin synthetase
MQIVVAGTDTDVGKTVFAAGLVRALGAVYYKPVQAGLDGETDAQTVARLSQVPETDILPETYRLRTPASPHLAAEADGIEIDPEVLAPPLTDRALVVEGAGGLCVPLTRDTLLIDAIARWNLPVILCARTQLGTINHSLLSIEALHRRGIACMGIAFIGAPERAVEDTIAHTARVPRLGRLAPVDPLTPDTLARAFADGFRDAGFTPNDKDDAT